MLFFLEDGVIVVIVKLIQTVSGADTTQQIRFKSYRCKKKERQSIDDCLFSPKFYMFYVAIILNDEYINKYSNHMIGYPLISEHHINFINNNAVGILSCYSRRFIQMHPVLFIIISSHIVMPQLRG